MLDPGLAAWLRSQKIAPQNAGLPSGTGTFTTPDYVGRVGSTPTPTVTPTVPKATTSAVSKVNAAPNLNDLYAAIYGDPGYQSAKAGADLGLSSAAAARRAALRQLVLQYGGFSGVND